MIVASKTMKIAGIERFGYEGEIYLIVEKSRTHTIAKKNGSKFLFLPDRKPLYLISDFSDMLVVCDSTDTYAYFKKINLMFPCDAGCQESITSPSRYISCLGMTFRKFREDKNDYVYVAIIGEKKVYFHYNENFLLEKVTIPFFG